MNKLRVSCILVWLSQGLIVGLLLGQHQLQVLHPVGIPFLTLFLCVVVFLLLGLFLTSRCLLLRQDLKKAMLWFGATLIPVGFFMSSFVYAHQQWSERLVPYGIRGNIAIMSGGSLMEAQAKYLYPERMESDRLTMFYRDLATPHTDLNAMEKHVLELEQRIGRPLRGKIHWVRGSLLGQRNLSFLGLALGSDQSLNWKQHGRLDRHELAHAVLTQYRIPSADPPMVLHEGWAEAQSGVSSKELVVDALVARNQWPDVDIVDLFSRHNYHLDAGLAYSFGGAFVDFLLREYSVTQFIDIYNLCGEDTFETDFEDIYSVSILELQNWFWIEAERMAQTTPNPSVPIAVTEQTDAAEP